MKFKSQHIKGKGRGKLLDFPTINLEIPLGFLLQEGIWAVLVEIKGRKYQGALHFGPVPTFGEQELSLEVFLIDTKDEDIPELENQDIIITTIKRLRDIKKFNSEQELSQQISEDVLKVKKILSQHRST